MDKYLFWSLKVLGDDRLIPSQKMKILNLVSKYVKSTTD